MSAKAAVGYITDWIDEILPRGTGEEQSATVYLRRGAIRPQLQWELTRAIPESLRSHVDRCEAYLCSDNTLATTDPGNLTAPFRDHVYLIPKSSALDLVAPLVSSSPEMIGRANDWPHIVRDTSMRAAFWRSRRDLGPFARRFLDQLDGMPPRGVVFCPVTSLATGQKLGMTVTVRSRPFETIGWNPDFRRFALFGLADLGWTLGQCTTL